MALIQCPECGQTISSASETCIHCGYPLARIEIKRKRPWQRKDSVKSVIAGAAFLIGVVFMVLALLVGNPDGGNRRTRLWFFHHEHYDHVAEVLGRDDVRDEITDGDTVISFVKYQNAYEDDFDAHVTIRNGEISQTVRYSLQSGSLWEVIMTYSVSESLVWSCEFELVRGELAIKDFRTQRIGAEITEAQKSMANGVVQLANRIFDDHLQDVCTVMDVLREYQAYVDRVSGLFISGVAISTASFVTSAILLIAVFVQRKKPMRGSPAIHNDLTKS